MYRITIDFAKLVWSTVFCRVLRSLRSLVHLEEGDSRQGNEEIKNLTNYLTKFN